jgi:hypothetical protein
MKKLSVILLFIFIVNVVFAQNKHVKIEVIYFKAQLQCCQAKTCNVLEADVQKVIDNNFKGENVFFKEIKLNDSENASIIEKYNAKSQTVILLKTTKEKRTYIDVSDILTEYKNSNNFDVFQNSLTDKIKQLL